MDQYSVVDLGNIFDGLDDPVLRWFLALSMAANDLSLNVKLIREYGNQAEANYFFRVSFSHLKEIAKVVGEAKGHQGIHDFLKDLDEETRTLYQGITDSLGQFSEESLAKGVLSPLRNECFHYPDVNGKRSSFKDLPRIFKALDKKEVRFAKEGPPLLGYRCLFADMTAGWNVNQRLSTKKVDQISRIVMNLIQFVDHVLAYLKETKNANI